MIKIGYKKELDKVITMPNQVVETVNKILSILDSEYGEDRNLEESGGYVLILESKEDIIKLRDDIHIDLEIYAIPEYVDIIKCSGGKVYTNSLVLCNDDYAISLIIPMELTPQNLKNYIIE